MMNIPCEHTPRLLRAILAVMLAGCLLLTAGCGKEPAPPRESTPESGPGESIGETVGETVPAETDPVDPALSLTPFRQALVGTPQAFAVAYFGCHENLDSGDPVDPFAVMTREAPQLCADLPFLVSIPRERILGDGYGELYCIVPRDEDATVAVNRGAWDDRWVDYVYDEVLYRSESGEPILLFCNAAGWEPDTQVTITCSDGTVVTWYPWLNDYRCVEPLRDAEWTDLLWDFSPYAESLGYGYRRMLAEEWEHPTEDDLIGRTWGCDTYRRDETMAQYRVTFEADTCTVRWNDGIDAMTHEYRDAPWELRYAGDLAVLSIDFGEFAGELRYNLLVDREMEMLYCMMDITDGVVMPGWESLHRLLQPMDPLNAPEPGGMVGTWELAWTEVEGDVNAATPGDKVIVIGYMGSDTEYVITFTDNILPENGFRKKQLVVRAGEMYPGCGNSEWLAEVDHVGLYDSLYAVTLLDDGMLLMQDYWEFEDMAMVSYGWYRRVS